MAVSFERNNVGKNHDVLKVKIDTEDYLPNFTKKLRDIAKKAEIKGFRKGMVPTSYIQKVYGQSIFSESIVDILNEKLSNYLKEIDSILAPIGIPEEQSKLDMNNPVSYSFSFDIALRPALDISLSDLKVIEYTIDVEEKLIQDELDNILKTNAIQEEIDKPTADTDMLEIGFEEVNDLNEILQTNDALKGNRTFALNEFSPHFQDQLKNMEDKNAAIFFEKLDFIFTEKLDDILTALQFKTEAKNARFQVRIKKIYILQNPTLDEAFFTKIDPTGKITNEAALRTNIKEGIELQYKNLAQNNLHDQIYHTIIDYVNIEISSNYLDKYLTENDHKNYISKTAEEKEEYIKKYLKDLGWALISHKIGQEFNIKVTQEDIIQGIRTRISAYFGNNPAYQGYLDRMTEQILQNKEEVEKESEAVYFEKLFKAIAEQVQKTAENISFEALKEKMKNHHH